ncbi:unnamed protein product, partial [Mesorhabditis spiculigera]
MLIGRSIPLNFDLPTLQMIGHLPSDEPEKSEHEPVVPPLLERLVVSMPIWHLINITRETSASFLRHMEPGNFIVRFSDRANSLVLTYRRKLEDKVEHHVITNKRSENGGHNHYMLRGHSMTFATVPDLLVYYCEKGKLSLPRAVVNCESVAQLRNLALLGG